MYRPISQTRLQYKLSHKTQFLRKKEINNFIQIKLDAEIISHVKCVYRVCIIINYIQLSISRNLVI